MKQYQYLWRIFSLCLFFLCLTSYLLLLLSIQFVMKSLHPVASSITVKRVTTEALRVVSALAPPGRAHDACGGGGLIYCTLSLSSLVRFHYYSETNEESLRKIFLMLPLG